MGGLRSGHTHHGKIVATQPPQMRTIFWQGGSKQHFMFPHSMYVMYYTRNEGNHNIKYWLNRLHVAFSLEPFRYSEENGFDLQQRLYGMPLANYDVGLAICFYEWPGIPDPRHFAERVIQQWWTSPFQNYGDSFSHWLNTYNSQQPHFVNQWQQASKERNYDWLMEQNLIQPPHNVNLKMLFQSNKTLTDETDYYPNLTKKGHNSQEDRVRALAHKKWVEAGCPNDPRLGNQFWLAAEQEVLNLTGS